MNGNLKRYVVVYGTALDTMNARVYTLQTMYMLSPLEEFTVYYVQVFAETSVSGNQSNIVQAKTFEDSKFFHFIHVTYKWSLQGLQIRFERGVDLPVSLGNIIVKNSSPPPTVGRQITNSLPTGHRQVTNRLPTVGKNTREKKYSTETYVKTNKTYQK